MCGFAGLIITTAIQQTELEGRVRAMAEPLRHRGPDDDGVWTDCASGIGMGFRRLSVLDLSPAGHQPMTSPSGRYTIAYNGEVYNFRELRRELEGCGAWFRGHSDTEVVLAAFERWGIEGAVRRFIGMFAMAVWDGATRSLSLVRDRMGIKPLYYQKRPIALSFGSELKALRADPEFRREIDPAALHEYLRYLYIAAPRTIFSDTYKLLPGHILTVTDAAATLPDPEPYWSLADVQRRGLEDPLRAPERELVDELHMLLGDAVRLRMQADVPLGALLSGGIDSSTVVALMQSQESRAVKTFTIGFDDPDHDESPSARRVAEFLGTDHTELRVTGNDALNLVPRLPEIFDEPLADPSQIPTLLVCELARTEVTVALTGDGGDELLGGYNRYLYGERLIERLGTVPVSVQRLAAAGIRSVSSRRWNRLHDAARPVLAGRFRQRLAGEKLVRLGRILGKSSPEHRYRSLLQVWDDSEWLLPCGIAFPYDPVIRRWAEAASDSALDRMMFVDQLVYLPDDLLAKVDRASMAVSLEARIPLLDHRVVEFSWRLPRSFKIRSGRGKWLLREVLRKLVPQAITERPKMGFSPPVGPWLRGPLRSWAEDLLASEVLGADGLFDVRRVHGAWDRFAKGHGELALGIWALLQFQAWLHGSAQPTGSKA